MQRLGAAMSAAIFFLSAIYIFGFSNTMAIIFWSIGGLVAIVSMASGCIWLLTTGENYRTIRARRMKEEREAQVKVVTAGNQVFIADLNHNAHWRAAHLDPRFYANSKESYAEPTEIEKSSWQQFNLPKTIEKQVNLLPEPQPQLPNLFDLLSRAERVLVKGPSDSGKTTLFQNIVRQSNDTVIVVDPHYKPGQWPANCKIIGAGRNHKAISIFLDELSTELSRRYQLRAKGIENYKPLTVIIDEWMSISTQCKNATAIITEMITESRKAKMRLFIGSHSDQVEALGIKGQGKLREGLLIVRLYYDQITQERRSTFDFGKGERDCTLYQPIASKMVIDDPDTKFVQLVQGGMSRQQAAREVYKRDYAGDIARKGKKLLEQ